MPQSSSNAETLDTLSADTIPVPTWSWLPSLPKFPLNWRRRPLDDTISLPAGPSTKLGPKADAIRNGRSREDATDLPRSSMQQRQNLERRDRVLQFEPSHEQRRGLAHRARTRTFSTSTLNTRLKTVKKRASEPVLRHSEPPSPTAPNKLASNDASDTSFPQGHARANQLLDFGSYSDIGADNLSSAVDNKHTESDPETASEDDPEDTEWQKDLEQKWILNLSMAFRDKSDREKFFLTYAEEPNRWRRLTVSIDYRNASGDSLESDLKTLHYQRDKSSRIYESIYDSLPNIRFFDTVTNLKLQTTEGRLHVHVTEDVNEIIPYPPVSAIRHLELRPQELVREASLHFDSHLSGFVYKVRYNGRIYIKKEIPAPEMVEEFLYEINALCALRDEPDVIDLEGIVVDDNHENIKGLLLSYASQGALIDYIYEHKDDDIINSEIQQKWARQIIGGLSAIHEHGFVQGDFTLSNIVIDSSGNAKVIDINRRGCPVGWEPPEFLPNITNGQRISMFIGVKSDLYQLGMVLWGLGMKIDEPEREEPPLNFDDCPHPVSPYYKHIVELCLKEKPEERVAATLLLQMCDSATLPAEDQHFGRSRATSQPQALSDFNSNGAMTTRQAGLEEPRQLAETSSLAIQEQPHVPTENAQSSNLNVCLGDSGPLVPEPLDHNLQSRNESDGQALHQDEIDIDLDGAADEVLGPGGHSNYLDCDYGALGDAISGAGGQFSNLDRFKSSVSASRPYDTVSDHSAGVSSKEHE